MADVHAITNPVEERFVIGNKRAVRADVVIDTYAAGGAIVTAGELGLNKIAQVDLLTPSVGGYQIDSQVAANKASVALIVYRVSQHQAAAITAGTPAGTVDSGTHVFTGTVMDTHQHAAVAAIQLSEKGAGAFSLTIRICAWGW